MSKIETFEVADHFLTESSVSSHIIGYEPNELHNHNFIEFFYVLQGTCKHNYNGNISLVKTGDAFLLIPSDNHQFLPTRDSDDFLHRDIIYTFDYFEENCKSYYSTLFEDILNNVYTLRFFFSNETIAKIESIIPNMIVNLSQDKYSIAANIITKTVINTILEKKLIQRAPYPNWLTKIIYFMNSSESTSVSLPQFLGTIPLSQGYMCHKFKKIIGCSMTDYFNQQKMKYAYSLLRTTNLSLEIICQKIGFNNISHFYTLFKKSYNTTPAKIRLQN